MDGRGVLTFSNRDEYNGEWKDNKQNGQGDAKYHNGDRYVGEWKDNKKIGVGTYQRNDGNIQIGYWEDDVFFVDNKVDLKDINQKSSTNSINIKNKYIKYKFKYLQLKKNIKKQV